MKLAKNSGKIGLAQSELVLNRLCNELYKAGLNLYRIAKLLDLPPDKVRSLLPPGVDPYPENAIDENSPLVERILYDFDIPVGTDVLIEHEKQRYTEYSRLERTALRIMNGLLDFYSQRYPTGDLKEDKEIARLAAEFIRVTHSARQELLQKYAIDKNSEENKDNNCIKIEFLEGEK